MSNDCVFISVESRKGGVGKTTAALNLAELLLEYGYAVLYLDIDISGTNTADVIKGSVWNNSCHVVKTKLNDGEHVNADLLQIFNDKYMSDTCIPSFKIIPKEKDKTEFGLVTEQVNIIGSQIYHSNNTKKDDSKNDNGIINPNVLFDELHAIWFTEFLQEICSDFYSVIMRYNETPNVREKKKVAFIFDNSPGFVGFSPSIHEWLTDLGPDIGKFLTVSSLDVQDMISCGNAIHNIHRKIQSKDKSTKSYYQLKTKIKKGKENTDTEFGLNRNENKILLRLIETDQDELQKCDQQYRFQNQNRRNASYYNLSGQNLFYYHSTKLMDNHELKEGLHQYQGLVLNKVPIKFINMDITAIRKSILSANEAIFRLLFTSGRDEKVKNEDVIKHMISYDQSLARQFLEKTIRKNSEPQFIDKDIQANFKKVQEKALNPLDKLFFNNRTTLEYFELIMEEHHSMTHDDFGGRLRQINLIAKQLSDTLEENELKILPDNFRQNWTPAGLVDALTRIIRALLEKLTSYNMIHTTNRPSPLFNSYRNIGFLIRNTRGKDLDDNSPIESTLYDSYIYSYFASLIFTLKKDKAINVELDSVFLDISILVANIEAERIRILQEGRSSIYQIFRRTIMRSDTIIPHIERLFDGGNPEIIFDLRRLIAQFYNRITNLQSTIHGFTDDMEFIRRAVETILSFGKPSEVDNQRIKLIVTDVMIKRKINHIKGIEEINRYFSKIEQKGEFKIVLASAIKDWDITQ
jgi:hypothetical protein